jgi:hypothetical protein
MELKIFIALEVFSMIYLLYSLAQFIRVIQKAPALPIVDLKVN